MLLPLLVDFQIISWMESFDEEMQVNRLRQCYEHSYSNKPTSSESKQILFHYIMHPKLSTAKLLNALKHQSISRKSPHSQFPTIYIFSSTCNLSHDHQQPGKYLLRSKKKNMYWTHSNIVLNTTFTEQQSNSLITIYLILKTVGQISFYRLGN